MEHRNAAAAAAVSAATTPLSTTPVAAAPPPLASGTFTGLSKELNDQLEVDTVTVADRRVLKAKDPLKPFLPGQPRVRLSAFSQHPDPAHNELLEYLRNEHLTHALDELLPYMRYIFVSFSLRLRLGGPCR